MLDQRGQLLRAALGRATFYTTGMEHSPTSATGTSWERSPWHTTQRAAWEALKKIAREGDYVIRDLRIDEQPIEKAAL